MNIFSVTQHEFAQQMADRFGKGKRHSALLYSKWFKEGEINPSNWAEPQALPLIEEMLKIVDKSLPEITEHRDGETVKFLLRLQDGLETESVLIPMQAGVTLCISSQVGCKMGCTFCETGRMGLLRSLSVTEIIYVLLKDLNDSLICADQLADLLEGLKVKVNLIRNSSDTPAFGRIRGHLKNGRGLNGD
jgi:23S rRNA (adenine2503-C2)-methyltransferase